MAISDTTIRAAVTATSHAEAELRAALDPIFERTPHPEDKQTICVVGATALIDVLARIDTDRSKMALRQLAIYAKASAERCQAERDFFFGS